MKLSSLHTTWRTGPTLPSAPYIQLLDISHQDILDQVQRNLADEFLWDTTLSMDEIEEHTYLPDTSTPHMAYHRWNGMLPNDFRRQGHR